MHGRHSATRDLVAQQISPDQPGTGTIHRGTSAGAAGDPPTSATHDACPAGSWAWDFGIIVLLAAPGRLLLFGCDCLQFMGGLGLAR